MSRYLILCYAVECGLKSRLMRDRNLRDTNQMDNYTDETGQPSLGLHHNLARYLKEAKLPAQTIPPPLVLTDYRTKHSRDCRPSQVVQPHQYHEAFRYSVELEEEPHLITQLTRILQALEAS